MEKLVCKTTYVTAVVFSFVLFFSSTLLGVTRDGCDGLGALGGGTPLATRAATPIVTLLPDQMTDAVTMKEINERAMGAKARAEARFNYYLTTAVEPTVWQRAMARAGLVASGVLGYEVVRRFLEQPSLTNLAVAGAASFVGLYLGDKLIEWVHWSLDNVWYNSSNAGLRNGARDARVHHEVQQGGQSRTYLERLTQQVEIALPILTATAAMVSTGGFGRLADVTLGQIGLPPGLVSPGLDLALGTTIGLFAFSAWHSNWNHQQAHNPKPNLIMRTLQSVGLATNRKYHGIHHQPPFYKNYAVVSSLSVLGKTDDWYRKRIRDYYERTGYMPGTWIQDPSAIPQDIVDKLTADYKANVDKLPKELFFYAPLAYPQRVPESLKVPMQWWQEKWRADFIVRREREFQWVAELFPVQAAKDWEAEQKQYYWIYGPQPRPLTPPEKVLPLPPEYAHLEKEANPAVTPSPASVMGPSEVEKKP